MLTIDEIRNAVATVGEEYHIRSAYLFGSYARRQANDKSDVDLYVDSGLKGLRFVGFVEGIRRALGGTDVDVIDRTHIEKKSEVMNEISKTGILVYER